MIETKALYAAATLTAIAVIFYEALVLRVNPARRRYDVKSPATAGNVEFERILRTQQNTLEQLPAFLAGLWLVARKVLRLEHRHTHEPAPSMESLARQHLGREVVSIQVAASYACRTRNSIPGARLSEHGRANALDVRGFVLAGGEVVSVRHGWHSWGGESAFLREVHRGACRIFTTVLGPNADRYHRDHFHFDLARHGRRGTYRVCR